MPLSTLAIIVLRLVAIYWVITGTADAAFSAMQARTPWGSDGIFSASFPGLTTLACGVVLFMWSRFIGRAVVPRPDPGVQLASLTVFDLYCFAFTFIGLYFVVSSVAPMINWLHFALVETRDDPVREPNFYELTQPLITMLAGSVCILLSAQFARKLVAAQRDPTTASA